MHWVSPLASVFDLFVIFLLSKAYEIMKNKNMHGRHNLSMANDSRNPIAINTEHRGYFQETTLP